MPHCILSASREQDIWRVLYIYIYRRGREVLITTSHIYSYIRRYTARTYTLNLTIIAAKRTDDK